MNGTKKNGKRAKAFLWLEQASQLRLEPRQILPDHPF